MAQQIPTSLVDAALVGPRSARGSQEIVGIVDGDGTGDHQGARSGNESQNRQPLSSKTGLQAAEQLCMQELSMSDPSAENERVETEEGDEKKGRALAPIRLRSKNRPDVEGDSFRYPLYLPDDLVSEELGFEIGDHIQITFEANASKVDGAPGENGDETPSGLYLRKVPDDQDPSTVKSTRKIQIRNLPRSSMYLLIPPRFVRDGLGIDEGLYSESEESLMFRPVIWDDTLVLVPEYEDGTPYELPEPSPSEEQGREEAPAAEEDLVKLAQETAHGSRGGSESYRYNVFLKELIKRNDVDIGPGDYVALDFDSGRESLPANVDDASPYDAEFDPEIFLGKVSDETDASKLPLVRKVRSAQGGMAVRIPPQFVTRNDCLGLDEQAYDSRENALLFRALTGEDAIMLVPVGYEDGTPYPIPRPQREEEQRDFEAHTEQGEQEHEEPTQHQQTLDGIGGDSVKGEKKQREEKEAIPVDRLAEEEYIEGTAIKVEALHKVAQHFTLSAIEIADALQRIEERFSHQYISEVRYLREEYPPLVASDDIKKSQAYFVDEELWTDVLVPEISDEYDPEDRSELKQILPRVHTQQAKQIVYATGSEEHQRFERECSAVVLETE